MRRVLPFFAYPSAIKVRAKPYSGIFPSDCASLDAFARAYLSALRRLDVLALSGAACEIWAGKAPTCVKATVSAHTMINPFLLQDPWTEGLRDRRVLIVHAFPASIAHQLERRGGIFRDSRVLPPFEPVFFRPEQALDLAYDAHPTWSAALDSMCERIERLSFDVALISAGSFAVPLAAFIKDKMRLPSIHLAGSMQLLFGIVGKRWENLEWLKPFRNDLWIKPLAEDHISSKQATESGAYW